MTSLTVAPQTADPTQTAEPTQPTDPPQPTDPMRHGTDPAQPTDPARDGTGAGRPGTDPVRLAGALAYAWLEVRAGRRPLSQLAPLLSPAARRRLVAQLPAPRSSATGRGPVRVRRVVASAPTETVREVAVVVEQQHTTTAIAVRMECHRGGWRAVELTAPESGLAPLPTASLPATHRVRDAFDEVLNEHDEA